METKSLSDSALIVINQYRNFTAGSAVCAIPYYNNRHLALRAGLKAQVGKGSPRDISEELENTAVLQKINLKAIDSSTLKKLLVDNNIGIDCSGLAYYILDEESKSRNKGNLKDHLFFPNATNIFKKLRAKMNPEKNAGVADFADERNSILIPLKDAQPGDIVTMLGISGNGDEREQPDHILVIHQVDYKDSQPATLHYTHAIAWPTDGEYGHGVRQGIITIIDPAKPITEQEWQENGKTAAENYTFSRAQKSTTTLRRLRFL